MFRDMAPLTDVWQPGMEVTEYHGPEVVEIVRGDGGARTPLPLGFHRSQSWLALEWGIEGGGWWVYRQSDLFGTGPIGDPAYGGVTSGDRAPEPVRSGKPHRRSAPD